MITKCKHCGASFPLDKLKQLVAANETIIKCSYCPEITEFRSRESSLLERGFDHLLLGEFEEARNAFEMQIFNGDATSDAYLGHALADFNVRVEFDTDYKDHTFQNQPRITCSRYNRTLFSNDPSYLNARRMVDREFDLTPALKEKELKWLENFANAVDSFNEYYNEIDAKKHGEKYDLFVAYDDEPIDNNEERRIRKARKYYEDANRIHDELGDIDNFFIADPVEREEDRLRYDAEILYAIEHSKCMLVVVEGDIIGFRLRNIYTRFYDADDLGDKNLGFVCLKENHPIIHLPDNHNADRNHVFELLSEIEDTEKERMNKFVLENIGIVVEHAVYGFTVKNQQGKFLQGATLIGYLNGGVVFSEKTDENGVCSKRLPAEEYTVRVEYDGYVPATLVTDKAGSHNVITLRQESQMDDNVAGSSTGIYKVIDDKHIKFGYYPQKREYARNVLNHFEDFGFPRRGEENGWKELFVNKYGQPTWYRDDVINGKKYRAVYISGFRDHYSVQESDIEPYAQTEHHYRVKELYCFAFEPLVWVIEKATPRQYTLVSEAGIDAQAFSETEEMSNQWTYSSLRQWLNHDFMETAFDARQENALCSYVGDEEQDKVYLLDKIADKDFYKQDVVAVRSTDYYQCVGGWGDAARVEKFWINGHNTDDEYEEASVIEPRCASVAVTDYVDSTGVAVLPKVVIMRNERDDKRK